MPSVAPVSVLTVVRVGASFTAVIVTVLVAMVVSVPLAAELALESVTE